MEVITLKITSPNQERIKYPLSFENIEDLELWPAALDEPGIVIWNEKSWYESLSKGTPEHLAHLFNFISFFFLSLHWHVFSLLVFFVLLMLLCGIILHVSLGIFPDMLSLAMLWSCEKLVSEVSTGTCEKCERRILGSRCWSSISSVMFQSLGLCSWPLSVTEGRGFEGIGNIFPYTSWNIHNMERVSGSWETSGVTLSSVSQVQKQNPQKYSNYRSSCMESLPFPMLSYFVSMSLYLEIVSPFLFFW